MGEYFVGITDKGKRRDHNEDTFIACEFFNKEFVVACVIDGVGGYSGGEVAAAITRCVILDHLKNLPADIIATLHTAVSAANVTIREERKKGNKQEQMACVLTCAVTDIKNNKLYYAHVGDTRLYLLRDHSLVKLSKDHSVVGFLEESGRLSEEDAMSHPRRNEITKALGFEADIHKINDFIETGQSPFLPGDTILVCSDGLTDMISTATISAILLQKISLTEKAKELVAAANEAGGNDNITAVLVQNNKQPTPTVALKPFERKSTTAKNPIPVSNNSSEEKPDLPATRKGSLIILLILFSLGILAVLLFQNKSAVPANNVVLKSVPVWPENDTLEQFMRMVKDSTKNYSFNRGASLLNVQKPVFISKDSFYIKGNGVTITSDSNYKGAAFIISNTAKHIVLDSIVFKNFDVAVAVQKSNVEFKNIQFINCRVPVLYQLSFTGTMISGLLKDSIFIPVSKFKKL